MSSPPEHAGRERFVLGMVQMFGAVTSMVLLGLTGLSWATVIAAVATTTVSVASRVRFRGPG